MHGLSLSIEYLLPNQSRKVPRPQSGMNSSVAASERLNGLAMPYVAEDIETIAMGKISRAADVTSLPCFGAQHARGEVIGMTTGVKVALPAVVKALQASVLR